MKINNGLDSVQKCCPFPKQSYQMESQCFMMILKVSVLVGGLPGGIRFALQAERLLVVSTA